MSGKQPKVEVVSADSLTPDPNNANQGTERGAAMLEASLREHGGGRSILLDKKGVVIAGNKTLETAAQIGLTDVVIVHTTGEQLVAVQRDDLDLEADVAAKRLAIADNRVGEVNLEWNREVLAGLQESRPEALEGLFYPDELIGLGAIDLADEPLPPTDLVGAGEESRRVIVTFADYDEQSEFCAALGIPPDESKVTYRWADIRKIAADA